jgi:hypothetical protein
VAEAQESLPEILDRLEAVLRAPMRAPERLLEELDDLNLVLELKGRIRSA